MTHWLDHLPALVQTASAVTVAVIAWKALGTWRRQLKGQARFDAAKRLLIASHELAQKFHGARSVLILAGEFPDSYNETAPNQRTTGDEMKAYVAVFNARWKPVGECYANIQGLLPEARAMLSDEIADAADNMLGCARQLHFWMSEYVSLLDEAADIPNTMGTESTHAKTRKEARNAVFAPIPQPGDEIDNKLTLDILARQRTLVVALKPFIEI